MSVHRTKNKNKISAAIESYKNGLSVTQIKTKYGLTINFFKKLLNEHGLEYVNKAKNPNNRSFKIINDNFNEIVEEYNKTKNMSIIAKRYNVSKTAIRDWLIRKNIVRRKNQPAPPKNVIEQIKFEVFNLYKQGMDKSALGKKFNLTRYHITKILESNFDNKHFRTKSQAITLRNDNPDFQRKIISSHYKGKRYNLPSGKTIRVMGYEDDFLDYVLQTKKLSEKSFDFEQRIYISYKDGTGNYRKYFPDFYIPNLNLVIEIKSKYTLNKQQELNQRKFEAAKKKYNFICIVDKNYKEFDKLLLSLPKP